VGLNIEAEFDHVFPHVISVHSNYSANLTTFLIFLIFSHLRLQLEQPKVTFLIIG
jgi:hypothetical protein